MTPGAEMSWRWIALALTLPVGIGVLVALPIWLRGKDPMIGGIVGTGVIFVAVVVFIGREYVELERFNQQCRVLLEQHIVCRAPRPEAFTRFGIYCFIGLLESVVLFSTGLWIEARRQRRDFAPEWRNRRN
jgi:hypothetical protein